ncbi:MAG: OmpA family protein [Pseudomonadota bacterium]|nr:OmpA family protein [Pseudomonadota bacterium]
MRAFILSAVAGAVVLTGCTTNPYTGQSQISKGALGALAGAALGAGVAHSNADKDKMGRAAAIGAVLGGGVGLYMDNQERKLREQMQGTGVDVERNPETGAVDLIMPGAITFATNSAVIAPNFTGTLSQLASTLREYDKSTITVSGHTDNTGGAALNQRLSQDRANSVAGYLRSQGVPASRIQAIGYGFNQPVASNATEAGRAQNRRVEISINPPSSI